MDFEKHEHFGVETLINVEADQNVRLNVEAKDYMGNVMGDSSWAQFELYSSLLYSDGRQSEANEFLCESSCVDGEYDGPIDIKNTKTDKVKVHRIICLPHNQFSD